MKKLSLMLIVTLMSVGAAEARRNSSRAKVPDYPRDSHHCASYECSDRRPTDPADDGFIPPFAGENDNGHDGGDVDRDSHGEDERDGDSDYIRGMPY